MSVSNAQRDAQPGTGNGYGAVFGGASGADHEFGVGSGCSDATESAGFAALAAALSLADGRLPAGGYAHSGGLEPAALRGDVQQASEVFGFVAGRVRTTGYVSACFAVAAWHVCANSRDNRIRERALHELDDELRARIPVPTLRRIGADLGRLLHRSLLQICPETQISEIPADLQQPLIFGAAGWALGLTPRLCAQIVLHDAATTPATAAVKILHLSPFDAHRAAISLSAELDVLAERAVVAGRAAPAELPATATPLADISALHHRDRHDRLFAS